MTDLQTRAKQHLMLHFSDMTLDAEDIPVLVRGDGCHIFDDLGNRYIDGLSGLYCTNLGHSHGEEIGGAAAAQMATLPFTTNWTTAHPPSIDLATKLAELAPPGFERTFFTSGGSEAVESAYKLARQFHQANGEPERHKVIARRDAYHGTSLGALSFTGIPICRTAFEPPAIQTRHVSSTNAYRHPQGGDEAAFTRALLDEIEGVIEFEQPETIAMMIMEPVQNAGGSLVPPAGYWEGLREICDRHGILLVSDEVICAFGRIGEWFGAQRLGSEPDMITFAKGLTGAHFSMGGLLMHERIAEPFLTGKGDYLHGITFGGHPVGSTIALKAIEIMEREEVLANVTANEPRALELLNGLRDIPIVGDVRGLGHFFAIECVKDQATRQPLTDEEAGWLLKDILSDRLFENGMICRLDDRAEPFVQIAPPLVAGIDLFEQITEILRDGLTHAAERLESGVPA
ncbi:MAG TPA: aspartate aminotransferase family protein [Solirubrobacterales bacterium]|nr:aspartate aminotransferase family protein [Solirubrobacterales bacterium]